MSTWYAQDSNSWGNSNLWNDMPDGSGNFGTPVSGDTCYCNGHQITVNYESFYGTAPTVYAEGTGEALIFGAGTTYTDSWTVYGHVKISTSGVSFSNLSLQGSYVFLEILQYASMSLGVNGNQNLSIYYSGQFRINYGGTLTIGQSGGSWSMPDIQVYGTIVIWRGGFGMQSYPTLRLFENGQLQISNGWNSDLTAYAGSPTLPSASQLVAGASAGYYDNPISGNLTLPAASDVKTGVQFGASGTQYTGTLASGGGGTTAHVF